MRVKVTPPYPGAGSFEVEITKSAIRASEYHTLPDGKPIPVSWCKEIPEITPEPGDIVEDFDGDIFVIEAEAGGIYYRENGVSIVPSRVLARKPKGFEEARDACQAFSEAWENGTIPARAAYETFLLAILGGAEYERVGNEV